MASKFSNGQTVFFNLKGREYQTVIEDHVWEKDGYEYSINIPGHPEIKWVAENELDNLSEEERELAKNKETKKVRKTKKMKKEETLPLTQTEEEYQEIQNWINTPVENYTNTPEEIEAGDRLMEELLTPPHKETSEETSEETADDVTVQEQAQPETQPEIEKYEPVNLLQVPEEELKKKDGKLYMTIPFSKLVSVESLDIPDADVGMRDINKKHVEHLTISYENGDDIPPVEIVASNKGYILVNGYHRQEALSRVLRNACTTVASNGTEIFNKEEYEKEFKTLTIETEVRNDIQDLETLINEAFQANVKNGLNMTDGQKGRYAIWLLKIRTERWKKGQGSKPTVTACANDARVSRVAVHRMLQRMQQKEKGKRIEDVVPDEKEVLQIETEMEDEAKTKELEEFPNAIKRVLSSVEKLVALEGDVHAIAQYLKEKNLLKKEEMRHAFDVLIFAVREARKDEK